MRYQSGIVRYCQIDLLNNNVENYELMIVDIETDEVIQRLAKDLVSSGFYLLGDHIKNYCKKGVTVAENISCHALNGSRFSRNLNCLVRI